MPSLEDSTAYLERVLEALEKQYGLSGLHCDLFALRGFPRALRYGDWKITVSVWMDR